MQDAYTQLKAENIGGGDALSQLNEELQRAVDNILDINKDPTAIRRVVLTIKLKPVKERQEYLIEFQAEAKLPPDTAGVDHLFLAKGKGYVPTMKQMAFEDFDPVTGEVKEEPEETSNVRPLGTASNGEGQKQ